MLTKYLALISESQRVGFAEAAQIAAALQKQITRDFTPIWQIPATIDVFASLDDVPSDYWPIVIKDDIGYDAAGIHLDRNGQPFALVEASAATALTCSHETIEMLVDPFGNRFVASQSIKPGQGRVNYLVEACDPSEGEQFGYTVNGILLSDFYTPNYFDAVFSASVRYSFSGAIKMPRQVLQGGYISWMVPETAEWWQAIYFGPELEFRSLGVLSKKVAQSWREVIDTVTLEPLVAMAHTKSLENKAFSEVVLAAPYRKSYQGKARQVREDIDAVIQASPFAAMSRPGESGESVSYVVKLSILNASGRGGDPSGLEDDADLSDLLTSSPHYVQLWAYLQAVVRQHNKTGSLSMGELRKCSTVQDVIDLVTTKIA